MNNNNNRFLSLTVIFFLPSRLPRQSYNYYVLLLLSSHTHYSLSLSCLTTRQTSPTHTNWEIPKVQGPGRLIMVAPSQLHTHTNFQKNNYGRRNIESKVIPPHHLISICQSFFSFFFSKLIQKRNKFSYSFCRNEKEPPFYLS